MKNINKSDYNSFGIYKPFEELQTLIKRKSLKILSFPAEKNLDKVIIKKNVENNIDEHDPEYEKSLFEHAMADVIPINRENYSESKPVNSKPGVCPVKYENNSDSETIACLDRLVKFGHGFVVSDTPEYMEGRAYKISPELVKRLHQGEFSIQAHVDLHGLNVFDARKVFDRFIDDSIKRGMRTILIVHGRGLCSPVKPVLKSKVKQWLTTGQWRKWVMAFASARSCDGGAGATYVLLREQPVTKSYWKNLRRINE